MPAQKSGRRVFIFIAIVCSGVVVLWWLLHFRGSDETIRTKESGLSPADRMEYSTAFSELPIEQQIAALKKEEGELAEIIVKEFPDTEEALQFIGNFHKRHGRREYAEKFWQKCLEINPRQLSIYCSLGETAFEAGEYEKAIDEYKKAVEIDPTAADIHKEIGHALLELGRHEESIGELEKEVQISPGSLSVHFLLGQAYFKQKKYEEAREHYETAIQLDPEYASAYYGLVRVCTALKEPEKAKEYELRFKSLKARWLEKSRAERASTLLPTRDLAAIRRSVIITYLDAGKLYRARKDFRMAEALLKRAVEIDPNNIRCFEELGLLYSMTERYPEALRQFVRISEIEPSNLRSYLNIGTILSMLNRYDEAERAYRKAIAIAPEESPVYLQLAGLYLRTQTKPMEARRLAQKAVSLKASGRGYFMLSWACDVTGDQNGALKAIEQAVRLEPENLKYRQIYKRFKGIN
ncbi:MAG: tetratricopeptide repeat protein [Phycisphaerae bacterium]|nr:tetratricopeptide repeat protein [Phycisphaerae bacterium]NIR65911.1 tetratricopeptide repeat protein [candidate division Zixibacteria bacterium]NIP55444.1 tetratricopeptide repeat protein [Phycisphaerae bacterium]NIS54152.1 tetratricopeptide repeat protein [Phycisphaerae bacterium]NIU10521.1 tetratricopeptide repeat protein [Phycisphaerae bacterium]